MRFAGLLLSIFFLVNMAVYAQQHQGHGGMEHKEMDLGQEAPEGRVCPVSGLKASQKHSAKYKGETYYFCCPACIDEFTKDPKSFVEKVKTVHLEAFQFGFSPAEIVVRKGDIVRLIISSRDVPHGIFLEEYGINVYVKKGELKTVEFLADKAGEFPVLCSVYCGRGHSGMQAKLIVEK